MTTRNSNEWLGRTLLVIFGVTLIGVGIATGQTWVAGLGSALCSCSLA